MFTVSCFSPVLLTMPIFIDFNRPSPFFSHKDPNAYSNSRLVQFVVMARVLRLGRLLIAFNSFQMFGTISVDIIPAASSVLLILLFILYFFASLGMFLYGGCKFVDSSDLSNVCLLSCLGTHSPMLVCIHTALVCLL